MLGSVIVLAAFALFIARLRRAERPRFDRVSPPGRVVVGRVVLARRAGPAQRTLGWSIVCDGREVYARMGEAPLELTRTPDGRTVVTDRANGRVATVSADDCTPSWSR